MCTVLKLCHLFVMNTTSSAVGCYYCRGANQSSVAAAVKETMKLRAQFPNYLAGFDLVHREDTGHPFLYYIDELLYPSQTGVDLPYFFHAGETGK